MYTLPTVSTYSHWVRIYVKSKVSVVIYKFHLVDIVLIDDIIEAAEDGVHTSNRFHGICGSNVINVGQLDEQDRDAFESLQVEMLLIWQNFKTLTKSTWQVSIGLVPLRKVSATDCGIIE